MSIKYAVNHKYVRAFIAAISALLMLAGVIYQINSEYQKLTTYISSYMHTFFDQAENFEYLIPHIGTYILDCILVKPAHTTDVLPN